MANTFKRELASITNTETMVYTVPAATTTVVIGFIISNTTDSLIEVDIEVAGKWLGKNIPIPAGSSLSPLDGKIVLEAADEVNVTADTATCGDAILSIMEIA